MAVNQAILKFSSWGLWKTGRCRDARAHLSEGITQKATRLLHYRTVQSDAQRCWHTTGNRVVAPYDPRDGGQPSSFLTDWYVAGNLCVIPRA